MGSIAAVNVPIMAERIKVRKTLQNEIIGAFVLFKYQRPIVLRDPKGSIIIA
jgi:hypothetical protein